MAKLMNIVLNETDAITVLCKDIVNIKKRTDGYDSYMGVASHIDYAIEIKLNYTEDNIIYCWADTQEELDITYNNLITLWKDYINYA